MVGVFEKVEPKVCKKLASQPGIELGQLVAAAALLPDDVIEEVAVGVLGSTSPPGQRQVRGRGSSS